MYAVLLKARKGRKKRRKKETTTINGATLKQSFKHRKNEMKKKWGGKKTGDIKKEKRRDKT